MNSSADSARVLLATNERPAAVRAVDGSVGVAALVRRAQAASDRRVEEARAAALEDARREVAAEVAELVRGCHAEVDALKESLLDNAIELGAVLAEAAVHRSFAGELDLAPTVQACFARSGAEAGTCRVRVHPDAVASLERAGITERVEVVADLDLTRGEVRLDTPVGTLVHDPNEALAQVRDALLTQLAGPEGDGANHAEAA